MTIDRLLVLLLSLSFLLLALPAAADMAVQLPTPVILAEQKGPAPEPARPDDTGLFLLSPAPEAPAPTGTDEAGGQDGLALPPLFSLSRQASAGTHKMPAGLSGTGQACAHPWPTGPPRA